MDTEHESQDVVEKTWRDMMMHGKSDSERRMRRYFGIIRSESKCKFCSMPFDHFTTPLLSLILNKKPSAYNPHFCNVCEEFARKHQGGAEIPLAMLFADIRGSTALAEKMSPTEFKRLIDRFYQVSTGILIRSEAIIDKLVGDEVTAFFSPGMAGPDYVSKAVQAAEELLVETGHTDPDGPWAPVGIGVHTGVAFFGAVGKSEGMIDITALGDAVNVAARLASMAKTGEIILSGETVQAAELDAARMEQRTLRLKGKSQPFEAFVKSVS